LLLLASEVSKRVDDDTKNKVKHDDDDNEEEQQVINHSSHKERFLHKNTRHQSVLELGSIKITVIAAVQKFLFLALKALKGKGHPVTGHEGQEGE
jgi:hypothetical protein